MKKIISLMLVILMMSFIFTSCGNEEPKEPVSYAVIEVSYNGSSYSFKYKDGDAVKSISNFKPNGKDKRVEVGGMNAYMYNPNAKTKVLYLDKDTYYALENNAK